MRREYGERGALLETDLAPDWTTQFARWFAEATAFGLPEPNAMIVATAGRDARPSARTVLLKGYDERGLVFFTNYGSRKGRELTANPYVSLLFPWHPLARQVVVTGTAARVGREETVAYFRTRPHGSQLGAWASDQSTVVASREELTARYEELAARYPEGEKVPAPPQWGGFRVVPDAIEFWQGRENRLHDRLRYVRESPAAAWRVERLCP
ncbi:MAG TPA: pyridoxamine 5'-phosphate oxidase [Streptomyces sp.]|uniref:pyridoxamine 5'-phosphate oxidase n=1 Tax=Streptomyces sp. TaxID=1931 RepID=UPI002B676FBA|nr:pyridoxamine 5'-phosphate oxidase [Streptomyces sp.]HWU11340.1 pyridoxamine 5'-phosphate oxidase [Streptomyces sp.]